MKLRSLRRKLQILAAGVVGVALLLFALGTAINLYNEQIEAIDEQLASEAAPLLEQIAEAPNPTLWLESAESLEILAMLPHRFMVVRDPAHRVLYRSGNLRNHSVPGIDEGVGFRTVRIDDATSRLAVFERGGFQLSLATDLEEAGHIVGDLLLAYLFALPLAVLAAAIGARWIAAKALAPVTAIADTAGEITAQRLDTRLPQPATDDEIARLTHILNRMLDRLERAFRSANRFSADASHELKTPLTIIRGRIEEVLQGRRTMADPEAFLADILEETTRLSGIAENLLLLAKADAWQLDLDLRETDLCPLVEETLEDATLLAAEKGIAVERDLQPRLPLRVDAGRIRQALLNLLENAVKYTETGGRIRVTLQGRENSCSCTVANSGPAIPTEKADQIFERFFRGDPARGDDTRGHGLGLSICRELIRAHGGEVELTENRAGHVEFRFQLPVRRE